MPRSLRDAKDRLSQLVRDAQEAPQTISVRGEERAVVLSIEAYRRLTRGDSPGLRTFLRSSPWAGVELELERERHDPRDIDLADTKDEGDTTAEDRTP